MIWRPNPPLVFLGLVFTCREKLLRKTWVNIVAIPDEQMIFSAYHGGGQQLGMGSNGPWGDGLFCLLHHFPHRPVHRRSHPTVGGGSCGRHGAIANTTRASPAGVSTVAQSQKIMTFLPSAWKAKIHIPIFHMVVILAFCYLTNVYRNSHIPTLAFLYVTY